MNTENGFHNPNKTHHKFYSQLDSPYYLTTSNVFNIRQPGISEYQSCNSLQNSIHSFTFGKADRFKFLYNNSSMKLDSYSLNSRKNKNMRATSFGFGDKLDLSKSVSKNNPSPNAYTLPSLSVNLKTAKSILSKLPKKSANDNPGVGQYSLDNKSIDREKIKIILKSRISFFYEDDIKQKKYTVSPQTYTLQHNQVKNLRFNNISFGKGERLNTLDSRKQYPGPGSYNIPNYFGRSKGNKIPLN